LSEFPAGDQLNVERRFGDVKRILGLRHDGRTVAELLDDFPYLTAVGAIGGCRGTKCGSRG
jgi:hypothetical protein